MSREIKEGGEYRSVSRQMRVRRPTSPFNLQRTHVNKHTPKGESFQDLVPNRLQNTKEIQKLPTPLALPPRSRLVE